MSSSVNLLGLPQDKFGLAGIQIGNLVSQEVAKQDKALKAKYDPISNKISILNTSDLPPSVLNKILYETPASCEYDTWRWYPVVDEERNKEGNLEIHFSCLKPGVDHSRSHSTRFSPMDLMDSSLRSAPRSHMIDSHSGFDMLETFMHMQSLRSINFGSGLSERLSVRPSFTLPTVELEEEALDAEEVSAMEKSISEGVISSMGQFFNKHEMCKGIWYPNDYRKYLMDEFDIEMDESFCTGFANEKFFEKTGRFTFKLKDGEKASEALLSFLNGPTVADCGNATMACYYKCILDIIGEEKFDQLFSSKFFALTIGQNGITDKTSPISYLAEYTEASKQMKTGVLGKRPLQIGEECHFDGIIWYANKHPEGFGGGWNVIYVGDDKEGNQLFMAHGFEKPLTESEINQKLLELYNRERTLQDEQHVAKASKPKLYDKRTNGYLMSHYTVSEVEVGRNTSRFIKGFLVGSVRGLQANELVKLKNSKNMDEFILRLLHP